MEEWEYATQKCNIFLKGVQEMWWIIAGVFVLIVLVAFFKNPKPEVVRLAKYMGYEEHTEMVVKHGRDSSLSYNSRTGSISYSPGVPPSVHKETTDYTLNFQTPDGKHYQDKRRPLDGPGRLPDGRIDYFEVGTIGTIVHTPSRFQFNILDDQKTANEEYLREAKKASEKRKEEERLAEEKRKVLKEKNKTLEEKRSHTSSVFMWGVIALMLSLNLSIILTYGSGIIANRMHENNWFDSLPMFFNVVLDIVSILVIAAIAYISLFAHLLVTPALIAVNFRKKPSFFLHLFIVAICFSSSYFIGNYIEPQMIQLGSSIELPKIILKFFGNLTNFVVFGDLATTLIYFILHFFIKLSEKSAKKYDDLFNQK